MGYIQFKNAIFGHFQFSLNLLFVWILCWVKIIVVGVSYCYKFLGWFFKNMEKMVVDSNPCSTEGGCRQSGKLSSFWCCNSAGKCILALKVFRSSSVLVFNILPRRCLVRIFGSSPIHLDYPLKVKVWTVLCYLSCFWASH